MMWQILFFALPPQIKTLNINKTNINYTHGNNYRENTHYRHDTYYKNMKYYKNKKHPKKYKMY